LESEANKHTPKNQLSKNNASIPYVQESNKKTDNTFGFDPDLSSLILSQSERKNLREEDVMYENKSLDPCAEHSSIKVEKPESLFRTKYQLSDLKYTGPTRTSVDKAK
jgi:hypothetical protein